jgi:hypothetical protein
MLRRATALTSVRSAESYPDRLGADFVSTVIECSYMAKFIERAAFRIAESDRTSDQVVPVSSTARLGDDSLAST